MSVRTLMKFLVGFVPLALAGCAGPMGGFGSDAYGLGAGAAYDSGKAHFTAGHFGLAVKQFQLAVSRDPRSVEALNGLAAAYDRLGRFDLSARYYQRALVANPDSAQTLNNIGYSYLMQGRRDLAVAYLRDAHARDGVDPIVTANRQAAEAALAEADLQRAAAPRSPVEAPSTEPEAAPAAGPAKPWIERTAPSVQTLVTTPQFALSEAGEMDPGLVGYRPRAAEAPGLLPRYMAAPITDPLTRTERPADDIPAPPARVAVARLVTQPVDQVPLPPPGPEAGAVVEVSNGTGRLRMAARIGSFLGIRGHDVEHLSNADHFSHLETTIFYREGWKRVAQRLADLLPVEIILKGKDDQEADVRIELGGDLLDFDRDLYMTGEWRSVDANSG
jgi:tetratricopeptide (TPR) repeat protein